MSIDSTTPVPAAPQISRPIGRIPVTEVFPVLEDGDWPAKGTVGEPFPVRATVFREGHDAVAATALAGEPITAKLSHAPGNGAAIGGLKVQTEHAWFAARPSGTEDVYKLYAESLRGPEHLAEVQAEARAVVAEALGSA